MSESLHCICCDSNALTQHMNITTDRDYTVQVCKSCGVVATFPRPTELELQEFYGCTYFSKNVERVGGYTDYSGMPEVNARLMWKEFQQFVPHIAEKRGAILDYGCATGGFLDEAKKSGWTCKGVELSEFAATRARESFGLDILNGDLFDSRLQRSNFDVLTMWHVLEHVISPKDILCRARDLLRSEGMLLVELPNWNSIGRIIRGNKWAQLRPPEHINFFTPRTLCNTLERLGFRIEKAVSVYPSLTNRITLKSKRSSRDFAAGTFGYVVSSMGLGGYARVMARKV
jgi:2-polyprenyl-3-methyl-5-hydroxy-6-metoxy-1,4-benzoquinol methylase